MKLRSIALLFAAVFACSAAHAQGGVYATMDAEQFTRTGINAVPDAPGSANEDQPWLLGPTVGAYYTITKLPMLGTVHTGPVGVGIDGRFDIFRGDSSGWPGGNYARADGFFGVRVTAHHPMFHTAPYAQASIGIGHTRIPYAQYYTNNLAYQFAVGADHKIKGRFDWRVLEASAGFLGNYKAGANANTSNYIITVGTGLVYRLGGK